MDFTSTQQGIAFCHWNQCKFCTQSLRLRLYFLLQLYFQVVFFFFKCGLSFAQKPDTEMSLGVHIIKHLKGWLCKDLCLIKFIPLKTPTEVLTLRDAKYSKRNKDF